MEHSHIIREIGIETRSSRWGETFYEIPLTWRLGVCSIEALKIRYANWKPKIDRSNQAIFYFDVRSSNEVVKIINSFRKFDFQEMKDAFEKMYLEEALKPLMNTGETWNWIISRVIPELRSRFKNPYHE